MNCYFNTKAVDSRNCVDGGVDTEYDVFEIDRSYDACGEAAKDGEVCHLKCAKEEIYYEITNKGGARCNGTTGEFENILQCAPRGSCDEDLTLSFSKNNATSSADVAIVKLEQGTYCYNHAHSDTYKNDDLAACANDCIVWQTIFARM